ncbi:ABC transporter permease [Paradevosia shaoguanensis]|uniref:ABC transporter permease n=1 Tax=Paradevosia shaoguanensis TaxID=1335043 RepID=UPI000455C331|nr:ABC transporter permease [Paradevosia shaoguanensis]QMV03623.1 ABC transporter permease subunit [Devosia sp. D6-9]CDP52047.1 Spermidine Putrescine ABC transporter permease com ponent potC [Devosia sp. DBB001]
MTRNWPHIRHIALALFCAAGAIYIVAPLAIVVLNSFSSTAYNVFPPEGYSLRWYENLAQQGAFLGAAVRSVILATLATAIALVIGTLSAYALVKYRLRGRDIVKAFLMAPVVLPSIVLGVALFIFFVRVGIAYSYPGLLLTHVLVVTPFVIAITAAGFSNFDWSTEEAAMDLGAGPIRTFFRVVLPQIRAGVLTAGLFAWITSFDQVETTLFLVRPGDNTLPIEMFLYLQKWQDPTIAALSSLLILLAVAIVIVMSIAGRNRTPDGLVMQGKEPSK